MTRILFLLAILLLIDIYIFQAYRTYWLLQKWPGIVLYWGITVLTFSWILLAVTGRLDQFEESFAYYAQLRSVFFILYLSKVFLLLPLLIDDIRRLVTYGISAFNQDAGGGYWPDRSDFLKKLGVILGSLPFITLTYGMRNPFRFQRRYVKVPIKDLPDSFEGLKIIQISDLHSGTFSDASPFKRAVELINQEEPDIVFFTGDLVNNKADEADAFVPIMKEIRSKYGVYSILGNHDYGEYENWKEEDGEERNLENLFQQHERMGWDLLLNDSRPIQIGNHTLNLLGVENYSAFSFFPKYGDLKKTWERSDKGDLNILLSHDPTHWDEQVIKDYPEIALTLSGHTHGFQFGIEIPGWVNWSPSQWVYDRWAGLYQEQEQFLYVNRGLGCLGYPGRVGILPEISIIELKKSV